MPWKESSVVDQRHEFIIAFLRGEETLTQLCERFGISRKTGYKYIDRFTEDKFEGLRDRPRAPAARPMAFPAGLRARVLELREATRCQREVAGPAKLRTLLEQEGRWEKLPAESTIALWLKKEGASRPYRKRRSAFSAGSIIDAKAPNDLWCMDLKGCFRVGSGERCDPLTVIDAWSRYALLCEALFEGPPNTERVKRALSVLFEEHGMPQAILTDNGPPFGSPGYGGLSALSVWLMRLGVTPLRIMPGKPWQNGRLERFHRTLKAAAASPPAPAPPQQQRALDRFAQWYNNERLHEGLGMRRPAQVHKRSERAFPGEPDALHYPEGFEVRMVSEVGAIGWYNKVFHITAALRGEIVGLQLHEDEPVATVYLGDFEIGKLDLKKGKMMTPQPKASKITRAESPAVDYREVLPM